MSSQGAVSTPWTRRWNQLACGGGWSQFKLNIACWNHIYGYLEQCQEKGKPYYCERMGRIERKLYVAHSLIENLCGAELLLMNEFHRGKQIHHNRLNPCIATPAGSVR